MVSAQRFVQQWARDFRQWLGERLGVKMEPTRQTVSERMIIRPDTPRQSRGIHM
jgi:hypothetical protein